MNTLQYLLMLQRLLQKANIFNSFMTQTMQTLQPMRLRKHLRTLRLKRRTNIQVFLYPRMATKYMNT